MEIKFAPETEQRLKESIKAFLSEHLDEDIGDLKAGLFLDYCREEICPSVYNQAISDAQAFFTERIADLDGSCYVPEFGYWKR